MNMLVDNVYEYLYGCFREGNAKNRLRKRASNRLLFIIPILVKNLFTATVK